MGQPGTRDELHRTGIGLVIVGGGLVVMTGCMAVLMIDGFAKHVLELTVMLAIAGAVIVAGIGCMIAARVRAARRARAANKNPSTGSV